MAAPGRYKVTTGRQLNPVVARLLEIQSERRLGNGDLAAALGLNRSQWWRVKTGASEPGRRFIEAACAAFPELSGVYMATLNDAHVMRVSIDSDASEPTKAEALA
jgi:hypothetical protein